MGLLSIQSAPVLNIETNKPKQETWWQFFKRLMGWSKPIKPRLFVYKQEMFNRFVCVAKCDYETILIGYGVTRWGAIVDWHKKANEMYLSEKVYQRNFI